MTHDFANSYLTPDMPFHIETQEIRAFKAVVDANGFKKAADRLFVTQSAISQSIASLERKLDTQLLERNPLKPTEAGLRMLAYAQMVLTEESGLMDDIRDIKQGIHSTLRLAISSTVNALFGAPLFSAFSAASPLTKLKINVMPSRQIYSVIAGDSWELGFGPFQQTMPEHLSFTGLFEDHRELIISRSHPAYATLADNPDQLLRIPLIVSHLDDPDLRPAIEKLRDSFGTIWEVNDLSLRVALVAQGHGMTYLDRRIRARDPAGRDLAVLDYPRFSRIPLTFGLFHHGGRNLSAGAERFISFCRAYDFS